VNCRIMLRAALAQYHCYSYPWLREIKPLIWRYAISWASGYLIFNIYTPIAFHFHGAVVAGQVGISIALWTAIHSLSYTWISIIIPKIGILISRQSWVDLDKLFFRNLKISLSTFLFISIIIISCLISFKGKLSILNRFLDLIPMICLMAANFFQIIISAVAIYLRAHKEEPLVTLSVMIGIFTAITTFLSAKYLAVDYYFLGYSSSFILAIPWIAKILVKKRLEHNASENT